MELVKRYVGPWILIIAGLILGISYISGGLVGLEAMRVSRLYWENLNPLLNSLSGILEAALFIMLAFLARAYYAKSQKVLFWMKLLRVSTYALFVYSVLWLFPAAYYAVFIKQGGLSFDKFGMIYSALERLAVVSGGLVVLDLTAEYMEMKAESFLTI